MTPGNPLFAAEDPQQSASSGAPLSPSPDAEYDKVDRQEVGYGNPPHGKENETCGRCAYYDGAYRCDLVRGDILPTMWCTEWTEGFRDVQSRGRTARGSAARSEATMAANVGHGVEKPLFPRRKVDLKRQRRRH